MPIVLIGGHAFGDRPGMDEYLVNRVLTASPEQLHLMIVDGCLRHCRAAEQAITDATYDAAHTSLDLARQHLSQLLAGLSPTADDEFLVNLRGLFKLAFRNLTLADLQHDVALVQTASKILSDYRQTWLLVMENLTENRPAPTGQSLAFSA